MHRLPKQEFSVGFGRHSGFYSRKEQIFFLKDVRLGLTLEYFAFSGQSISKGRVLKMYSVVKQSS